jgi:hypothetical protein
MVELEADEIVEFILGRECREMVLREYLRWKVACWNFT